MIYLLSDLHGGEYSMEGLKEYLSLAGNDDLLIIAGDIMMNFEDSCENRKFTEFFLSIDKNIAFIDGNHENFDYLESFSEEQWCGGTVHRINKSIVHLMRGHIFNIQGKTFFAMGGSGSSAKWKELGLWSAKESPSPDEIKFGMENLKKHGNKVDYILSHKYKFDLIFPFEWQNSGKESYEYTLEGISDYIDDNVDFKRWYSGHLHHIHIWDDRHHVIYDKLTPLTD